VQRRKITYFRDALDLRDRIQVRVVRRRPKLADRNLAEIARKPDNSPADISKEVAVSRAR
jgi:hypothetical protein